MKCEDKELEFFTETYTKGRDYKKSLSLLKKSIEKYGFIVPVIATEGGKIISGNGRLQAAKELGLKSIPTIIIDLPNDLCQEFAWVDNKISNRTRTGAEVVKKALEDSPELKHFCFRNPSPGREKEKKVLFPAFKGIAKQKSFYRKGDFFFISFLRAMEKVDLKEIKHNPNFYNYVIEKMSDYIKTTFKDTSSTCIVYPPPRRTPVGNIAEKIATDIGEKCGIKVYSGAFVCHNKDRINPDFELTTEIKEQNVLLIDDILTTGSTIKKCYDMIGENKNIHIIVGLLNTY